MGSSREHGGGSGPAKGRKRQLVLESSDSEADDHRVSTPVKPGEAAAGNADHAVGDGDQSAEKVAPVGSEKLAGTNPGAKTTETCGSSEKNNIGDELNSSSAGAGAPPGSGDESREKVAPVSSDKLPGPKTTETNASSEKNTADELNSTSAGAGVPLGCGDEPREKVAPVSSDKLSSVVKSNEGDYADNSKGDKLGRSSSQPDTKRRKTEDVHVGGAGNGGSASKDATGGKMLRPGFPKWRFEKPEVRAGRVEVEMKPPSGSKVKERVSGSNEKRHVEPLKHEKHKRLMTDRNNSVESGRQERRDDIKTKVKEQASSLEDKRRPVEASKHVPLKTDKGGSPESGHREVLRVQGKSGLLKILPKKAKVDGETSDSNTPPKNAKVVKSGDGKIRTKTGVLKLLPKNIVMASENSDGKLPSKSVKSERETTDGKILTKTSKVDRETGDDKVSAKKIKLEGETSDGRIPARNNRVDGETITGNRRDKDTSSALSESQKHDANGEKTVTKKLVSSVTLRRSDPSVVGVSSGHTTKPQSSKAHLKVSSQPSLKDGKTKLGEHKNEKKRLLEHKGAPENLSKKAKSSVTDLQGTSGSALEKHAMKKPRGGPRSALKQKLRDQIKGILLNNGWTIDLRPRRDKDYEDSVYVSPQGTGYWSITKAYAVYQGQLESPQDEEPISKDDLAMLQRIVRKRRGQKEHSAEKKSGNSKSRKSKDNSTSRSSRNTYQNNEEKVKTKNRGCGLLVRGNTRNVQGMGDYIPYKWKRTVLSWMIDLGVVSEDAKVKYMNKKGKQAKIDGRITRDGIYCGCCSKTLTAAKFELHAGSKEQQPYANIFLEDGGVPLLQCLLDAWDKQAQDEKKGFYKIDPAADPDDDTCGICGDGGDLLCCDHCTSTFHVACLGIEMPSEDWYCRSCICKFCGSAEETASSLADLLSCLQCSRKYHQACAQGTERDSLSTTSGASIDCFCSPGCRKIYKRLKKLVGFKNDMEAGFSWSLVRCFADSEAAPPKKKAELALCNSKTAIAFSVMDECFLPRIDERSGINIVHNVVFNCGSDFNRLNFSGFYTFILERGDEVIAAATVRIHGTELAEMPFIGTRGMYRRKGMCHRLLNAIESTLCSLNVRRLVIPAIPELQNTWSTVFGFKPVGPLKKQKFKSFNLLIIHGTGLLDKRLLLTGQVNQPTTVGTVNAVECDKTSVQMLREASGSITPVHASQECAVGDNIQTKDNDTSCALTESSSGLAPKLPPVPEEKPQERASCALSDVNLRTSEDDVPCKAEADNKEEVKYAEADVTLVADITVEKPEDKSSSSYADLSAIPVTMDTGPCSSNELGKGEICPHSELSVDAVLLKDKTESNLKSNSISARFDTQEDMKSCVAPLVTRDLKPDNHELKTIVADGDTQSSLEVEGLEVMVNERSRDAYTTKDQAGDVTSSAVATTEEHSPSAVEIVVSTETERSLDETKFIGGDNSEVKVATIEVGAITETSNEAVITISALERSNDIYGEDTAKPALSCGEGQLHGEDGVYKNSLEDGLASRDPVNA